jgi:hypothetical protein
VPWGTTAGIVRVRRVRPDDAAAFAVFVDDTRQGQGIGPLLLEHLAARRAGISELLRLGRLAEDPHPEVAELDLNPILAGSDGVIAVDVTLRLSPVSDEPDPYLRGLREPTWTIATRRREAGLWSRPAGCCGPAGWMGEPAS